MHLYNIYELNEYGINISHTIWDKCEKFILRCDSYEERLEIILYLDEVSRKLKEIKKCN
jgi:hypothetical protein